MVAKVNILVFTVMCLSNLSAQVFTNSATSLGINHTYNSTVHWGAGVSFFDFDNDGWDDITLLRHGDSALFYKNMGGYFELLPSMVYVPGRATQIIWVDYDNDGDNDFFLSTFEAGQCRLYQNNGTFGFTDVTLSAGLIGLTSANYGVSFADYDKDGDLDLYLCRYYMEGNALNSLNTNALYRNNGDGTFTNVTIEAGVGNGIRPSFMSVWLDYNNDTYPDLYVINDRGLWINTMYRNNGDGTFTDVTSSTNTAMQYGPAADDPMSATFADFDNDGDNDIYATNTGGSTTPARFLVAQNSVFTEQAAIRNVNLFQWAWGATFIDVDNDSWQDLYVTTGTILANTLNEVRNYLYMSNYGVNFTDSPQLFSGSNHIAASYSVAKGDINNDGFADMIVTNAKGFSSWLWLNTATSPNNYVKVSLEGTVSNRMAIGSWIRVYADTNTYSFYTRCGENYCSQNSQHHIFGLGEYEIIDSIKVTYLSGIVDTYYNLDVNQHYYFTEGETLVFQISYDGGTAICENTQIELTAPDFQTYLWSNGAQTQSINVDETGYYSVIAYNSLGHQYVSDTVYIQVMNEVYIADQITHVTCIGDATGSIQLTIFNQTENYELTWQNGSTELILDSLEAGYYVYEYADEFACIFSGAIQIIEPTEIILFWELSAQTTFETGVLQLLLLGGTPPYVMTVNGTPWTVVQADVDSGYYQIVIVDANGCEYQETIYVPFIDLSKIDAFDQLGYAVFPNPSHQHVLVFSGFSQEHILGVYDMTGGSITARVHENWIEIDESFHGSGIIILQIDGKRFGVKFVVL